jgi:hypothetical protein
MPKAARERGANPRAGAALAPLSKVPSRKASLDEQDSRLITEMGTDVKRRLVIRDGAKVVMRGLDPRIHGDDPPGRTWQLIALSPCAPCGRVSLVEEGSTRIIVDGSGS